MNDNGKTFTAKMSIEVTNKNRHDIERLMGIKIPPIPKKKGNINKKKKKR